MKTMNLIINGNPENVQVERYFRALNNQYLIYSKDGADIDGNVRINVIKIENNQVVPIEETEEWDAVKKIIVEIVNDNREMTKLSVEDLDYHLLENLTVTDAKALRLPSAVMPYLSANQPEFNNLEVKEQELDAKVEALKDMNQDLATMMDEVGKEFPVANSQAMEEEKAEEKMGATMEIIMPSKQIVGETKTKKPSQQKEKGHFNFKSLFGKKKDKEEVSLPEEKVAAPVEEAVETPIVTDEVQGYETINPAEEVMSTKENAIVNPVVEEPTPVETTTSIEPVSIPNMSLEETVETTPNEATDSEEPKGFDFFDTAVAMNTPEPIVVTPQVEITNEIPDVPAVEEEPMEILELDEEKYKALYEEEQNKVAVLEAQVQALNGNIKRLEETLLQYQEKLNQVKSIVD